MTLQNLTTEFLVYEHTPECIQHIKGKEN